MHSISKHIIEANRVQACSMQSPAVGRRQRSLDHLIDPGRIEVDLGRTWSLNIYTKSVPPPNMRPSCWYADNKYEEERRKWNNYMRWASLGNTGRKKSRVLSGPHRPSHLLMWIWYKGESGPKKPDHKFIQCTCLRFQTERRPWSGLFTSPLAHVLRLLLTSLIYTSNYATSDSAHKFVHVEMELGVRI